MLEEFCACIYSKHNGLVYGVDGLFKTFILINSKTYIFIKLLK